MISPPLCPECKKPMDGPRFEPRHREPDRRVLIENGAPPHIVTADCYYECETCKQMIVFDPLWQEMVE